VKLSFLVQILEKNKQRIMSMKHVLYVGSLWLASAVLSAYIYVLFPKVELVVRDQPVGTTIYIDRLILPKGGFVRMQEATGSGASRWWASDYMPKGVYTNFYVDIVGVPIRLDPGARIVVQIRRDNGDMYYTDTLDMPMKSWNGSIYEKTITFY
jgi:hypothetical protein